MNRPLLAAAVLALMRTAAHAEPPPIASNVATFEHSFTMQDCKARVLKIMSNRRFGDVVENKDGAGAATKDTAVQVRCVPELKTIIFIVAGRGVDYTAADELHVLIDDFQNQK